MDLNEYYLLLIVLMMFMLITNHMFKSSYWYIAGFWLLMNTWYAIVAMNQNSSNIVFGLIMACVNVLINIFYLQYSFSQRVK